jgi:hypothetical protein
MPRTIKSMEVARLPFAFRELVEKMEEYLKDICAALSHVCGTEPVRDDGEVSNLLFLRDSRFPENWEELFTSAASATEMEGLDLELRHSLSWACALDPGKIQKTEFFKDQLVKRDALGGEGPFPQELQLPGRLFLQANLLLVPNEQATRVLCSIAWKLTWQEKGILHTQQVAYKEGQAGGLAPDRKGRLPSSIKQYTLSFSEFEDLCKTVHGLYQPSLSQAVRSAFADKLEAPHTKE